jgi:hypothetical protein
VGELGDHGVELVLELLCILRTSAKKNRLPPRTLLISAVASSAPNWTPTPMVVMPTPAVEAARAMPMKLGVGVADVGALVGEEHDAGGRPATGVLAGELEADAQALFHGGGAGALDPRDLAARSRRSRTAVGCR